MSLTESMKTEAVPAELRSAALALSPSQRESLALDLFLSLETLDDPDPAYDETWADELDRRMTSIEDGTAKLVPADEVFARMEAGLRERSNRA